MKELDKKQIKKKKTPKPIDRDNSIIRGKGVRGGRRGYGGKMVMEGDLILGDEQMTKGTQL